LLSGADVQAIWDEHPLANIGIITGGGLVVVDLDKYKVNSCRADLAAAIGEALPDTYTVTTGRGGTHLYYAYDPAETVPSRAPVPGVEVQADGGRFVVAPPSVSGYGPYVVLDGRDPVPAPDGLIKIMRERAAKNKAETVPGGPLTRAVPADIATMLATPVPVGQRSDRFFKIVGEIKLARFSQGEAVTLMTPWCTLVDKYVGREATEVARVWPILAEPLTPFGGSPGSTQTAEEPVSGGQPSPVDLGGLVAVLRQYQDLPDPSHVYAVLAVAATRDLGGDPLWLLLVAPPSSGKTEAVRTLDAVADARLNEVTAAGLLTWAKRSKAPARPAGKLVEMGPVGLITFGDLSSLLATSDRGGRDVTFALLRRVYDGHASRDIAPPSGDSLGKLEWIGRATVVGAAPEPSTPTARTPTNSARDGCTSGWPSATPPRSGPPPDSPGGPTWTRCAGPRASMPHGW
jgi:hypothetical protein